MAAMPTGTAKLRNRLLLVLVLRRRTRHVGIDRRERLLPNAWITCVPSVRRGGRGHARLQAYGERGGCDWHDGGGHYGEGRGGHVAHWDCSGG